jgi:hypothetical protein
MLLELKKNSKIPGLGEPGLGGPSLEGQPGSINVCKPATSTLVTSRLRRLIVLDAHDPVNSTLVSWQSLHPYFGIHYINDPAKALCPRKTKASRNQDLPPDSSSHPKARGLLSWIWDTGTLMEIGRGPSWEVAQQADLNSLNKTRTAIRLVIEKRLVLILLGLYM